MKATYGGKLIDLLSHPWKKFKFRPQAKVSGSLPPTHLSPSFVECEIKSSREERS
jgi:hypothetical protein